MRALILLRHSLTEANERHLYCGWTDVPLSPAGRALAERLRAERPLPACDSYGSSGLSRATETLDLLTGKTPDVLLPDLRESRFGTFELRSYEALKDDPDYLNWIMDESGDVAPPGGESRNAFARRVCRGGAALLALPGESALAVLHGGVIVSLMQAWFPGAQRGFYDWQPGACRGYRIEIEGGSPSSFSEI